MGKEKDNRSLKEKILEFLGFGNEEFREYFDHANMQRGMITTAFTGVITLSVLILFIVAKTLDLEMVFDANDEGNYFFLRVAAYAIYSACSLACFVITWRYDSGKKYTHKFMRDTIYGYAFVSAFFGVVIATVDHAAGINPFVFVIMMIISTNFFILPIAFAVPFSLISFALFFRNLHLTGGVDFHLSYNGTLLMMALMVASGLQYSQKLLEAKSRKATLDLLDHNYITKLKNRRAFEHEYSEYIGKDLIVATVSIEEFKFYNDCYGAQAGNEILQKVSQVLKNCEWSHEVYHVGTSGFAVMLWDITPAEMSVQCAKWLEETGKIGFKDIETADLGVNIGYVYGHPINPNMMQRMIAISEHQNYRACRLGRNRFTGGEYDRLSTSMDEVTPMSRIYSNEGEDSLTGLMTMELFRDRASKIWSLTKRDEREVGFVYFDMANFKSYNQKYGFDAGDELIAKVASIIRDAFPKYIVGRAMADQFVLLGFLDDLTDKIEELHESVRALDDEIRIELKAGIYKPDNNEKDVSLICDKAKIACDSIKGRFDICWRMFDEKMASNLSRKEYILNAVDTAVEKGYIEVYYHPLMRTKDRILCGAEALARWNDPTYGFLSPADFIPILESNNLIYKLDRFMIRKICENQRKMIDEYGIALPVSFNLSRSDFNSVDTVEMVESAVRDFGISKDLLHVEVTESSLSDDSEFLLGEMRRFHEHGYHVWMDDFGSGYSSLNILQDYDFDVLKIDMEFLRSFHKNPRTREVISAIIDMTKRLGIEAVAEGVEEEDQYAFLQSIGCEMSQGYLFDKPEPYDRWVEFARNSKLDEKSEKKA